MARRITMPFTELRNHDGEQEGMRHSIRICLHNEYLYEP